MTHPTTWAVLPAKPLDEAKSRLESVLDAAQRRQLALSLLEHCLATLHSCDGVDRTLVVSSDAAVLDLAQTLGAQAVEETSSGLNAALTQARDHAMAGGAERLLVLAGDLPLVSNEDLVALLACRESVTIAPDRRRQGTNALLLRPPDVIQFAFGDESFRRHLELALTSNLTVTEITLPGLGFDVDLPEDWRDLLATGWRPDSPNGRRGRSAEQPGVAGPGSHAPVIPVPRRTA